MIVTQLGQCGIQVGQQLFDLLSKEIPTTTRTPSKKNSHYSQIIIDTERKTWQHHQQSPGHAAFPTQYIDNGSFGRGNNWAHGYWDISHLEDLLNIYRRKADLSDRLDTIALVHSIAGGTGAGLGSRLLEELRDLFPKQFLLSFAVAPFTTGETALQHYNGLLSLGWMHRFSDCITLFQNQEVMNAVVRQKQAGLGRAAASQVSLTEINAQIANCIAGLMLPTSNISGDGDRLVFDELKVPDMRTTLTPLMPIPDCKVLEMATSMQLPMTTRTASFANGHKALGSSWDDLASDLMRSLSVPATGARRRCMAARLQARGVVGAEYWKRIERIKSKFETKLGVDSQSLNLSASATYGFNIKSPKASLELLTNSSMTGAYLENTLAKAAAMYENRAYVHWYERYGGSEVHGIFEECFETLASARDAYASTN